VKLDDYDTVIGLNGSIGNTGTQSYSAQLAPGSGYFTSIKRVHTSAQSRTATVSAISETGTLLSPAVAVQLAAGASSEQDAQKMFALPSGVLTVGSIKVDASGDGMVGDVIFGDPDTFAFAAAIPLQTERFTRRSSVRSPTEPATSRAWRSTIRGR
jgi:hypothetical protein